MARSPLSLTDAQKAEVETLAAVLNVQQIADYFGVGRTTFFALIDRDPEIGERYKRGKARAVGSIAQSLVTKARAGDTACMIFYLKTQGGWRETSPGAAAPASTGGAPNGALARLLERIGPPLALEDRTPEKSS